MAAEEFKFSVYFDEEKQLYSATSEEFPGVCCYGYTPSEAVNNLFMIAMTQWESTIDDGKE